MKKAFETEKVKAVQIVYYFNDWSGTTREWQEKYFELLSWRNTWQLPLEMDIYSSRKNGAYLFMVIPKEDAERTLDWLDGLGYEREKQKVTDINVLNVITEFDERWDYCYIKED